MDEVIKYATSIGIVAVMTTLVDYITLKVFSH